MNQIDNITRDSKILVESAKDCITGNLLKSIQSSSLVLTEDQLKSVMKIVDLSLSEGYQRAIPVFQNTIKKYF